MTAIDRAILDEMAEIMGEEFPDLVRTYLESAPDLIQQLEAAAQQGGIDVFVGPSHSLKASSNDLGATKLAAIAQAIEHDARSGKDSARNHVPALRGQFAATQAELLEIIES